MQPLYLESSWDNCKYFGRLVFMQYLKGSATTRIQQNARSYGKNENHTRSGSSCNISNIWCQEVELQWLDWIYYLLQCLRLTSAVAWAPSITRMFIHARGCLAHFMSQIVLFHGDKKVGRLHSLNHWKFLFRSTQLMVASRRRKMERGNHVIELWRFF